MSHARSQARGTCGQQFRYAAKGKASSVSAIIPVDKDGNMQSATTPAAKRKGIQWEKNYSACTSWLIAWCKANNDAHIKLFSDSVKDAKDQGRKKKQSGISREAYYLQLVTSIFSNDEDPEMWLLFSQNPNAFIKPVQTQFGM
jgi:hypothetical protein